MSKTVIITGAGSGIGRAATFAFLKEGWNVVATMRDPAKAAKAGLPTDDPRLLVEALDVTADGSAAGVVERAVARFGRIDVLVNNAGYGPMGPLETMSTDEIGRIFQTNSIGPVRVAQAVIPAMRKAGQGRIINVSSMGGEFTTPFGGVYHASKYALESLSDALRAEVAPFGLKVVVIQPGPVATDLATSAVEALGHAAQGPYTARLAGFAETSRRQMARGQGVISPEQVAQVILQSASAQRPRTRYKIGMLAHVMPFTRRVLSDRLWDAMWARMIPTPRVAQSDHRWT